MIKKVIVVILLVTIALSITGCCCCCGDGYSNYGYYSTLDTTEACSPGQCDEKACTGECACNNGV